ncbi:hypothetical protein ACLBOM_10020 [Escherichia coli]
MREPFVVATETTVLTAWQC